jgi:uncharacterized membrane protein
MTAVHAQQLVDGYLGRLQLELLDLPPARRQEILDEIRDHIADERSGLQNETDADLMNLLDRLGDPAEIATAARDGETRAPRAAPNNRVGVLEILALVLTPLLWPVGVILLWASSAWTTKQKLIGTLLPPGGYLLAFFALPILLLQGVCVTSTDSAGHVIQSTCPQGWDQVVLGVGLIGLTIVLLVLPIVIGIYLATRLRARPTS